MIKWITFITIAEAMKLNNRQSVVTAGAERRKTIRQNGHDFANCKIRLKG